MYARCNATATGMHTAARTKKAGWLRPFLQDAITSRSLVAVVVLVGGILDLLAGLLYVLAGAGHGVAGAEDTDRKHGQQQQGDQTLHRLLLQVGVGTSS